MENETALKKPEPQKITTLSVDNSEFACFLDTAKFNQLWRVAQVFAASQLVPQHYQGKPNNCFVATQMALRLNVDPMMFMQNTFVIQGKPGMESKLVIALINARGPFEGPIQWRFTGTGDGRACTAYAKHKTTGEVCEATVSWVMATAEGWTTKSGSKWKTMPDLMFQYRSAAFLGRLYCPECLMGMRTVDELTDIKANEEAASEVPVAGVAGLKDRIAKQVESTEVNVKAPEQVAPAIDETHEAKKQEQIDAVNRSDFEVDQNMPGDEDSVPDNEAPAISFKCSACVRTYWYGRKEGFGVACECGNGTLEESDPRDKAIREAEATAEAKFGKDSDQVECRFLCNDCDYEYDKFLKIEQCPKCLRKNVLDRQEKS